jgi:hypothetical protein
MPGYSVAWTEDKAVGRWNRLRQLSREPITKTDVIIWMGIVPVVVFPLFFLLFWIHDG